MLAVLPTTEWFQFHSVVIVCRVVEGNISGTSFLLRAYVQGTMLANLLYFLLSFERATEVMCFSSQLLRHYTQTNERMLVRIWMSLPGTMSDACSAIHTRVPKMHTIQSHSLTPTHIIHS